MKKLLTSLTVILLFALLTFGASAKTVLKGDFNQDGRVTAADARSTLRASAKLDVITNEQAIIVDVSGDGKVTALDARTILRIAASLEQNSGEVEIPDSNPDEPTTNSTAIKTEVSGGIGGTTADFIKKYGGMRQVGTSDGSVQYTNDKITIISDPKMIYPGSINSIILTGDGYTLCGVFTGMTDNDAINMLKADKWTLKEQNSTTVNLTKNAMAMILTLNDGKVTKAEYKFSISLVNPDAPTTETETTTQPDETTTQPAETTTNKITGNTTYDELPQQIKTFLSGHFGIKGYNYSEGKKNPISMYVSPEHVKAGMALDSGSDSISLDILIKNVDNKATTKTYLIVPGSKQYCELSKIALSVLGISEEELQLNIAPGSADIKSINAETEKSAGVEYLVYTIDTGVEYCKIFTINGEIKRIETYGSADKMLKSRIDVTEFLTTVPSSEFSLDGYKKKTFIELFGSMI